jgi:hypothetical protein
VLRWSLSVRSPGASAEYFGGVQPFGRPAGDAGDDVIPGEYAAKFGGLEVQRVIARDVGAVCGTVGFLRNCRCWLQGR